MTEKGLVRRDPARAHRYAGKLPRERTEQQMVGDLVDRAFGGSASRLVLRALSSRPATPDELGRVSQLLDQIERDRR